MVMTGLTRVVCGCVIYVDRDEFNRVAKVKIKNKHGTTLTPIQVDAVKVAASLLAQQTARVLPGWLVKEWEGVD